VPDPKENSILLLLLALPLVLLGVLLHWGAVVLFFLSVVGIIPLAKVLGDATETLAAYTGPRIGAVINATLGNAAELIITVMALRAGLTALVKASITGSIIGNVLLVMGGAILLGGLHNGRQHFDRAQVGLASTQLTLSVIALAIPTLFAHSIEPHHHAVELLSRSVAMVMVVIYLLGLLFGLVSESSHAPKIPVATDRSKDNARISLLALVFATAAIAWLSEVLVGTVEPTIARLGLSEFFIGIIIVPIVGNVAEHLVAVNVAMKDEMDLSLGIALGSSTQIALFVAPLLVFISIIIAPKPLTLTFHPFELAALGAGTLIAAFIAQDGESNWMEGAQLLGVFLIIALAFFFLPVP